MILDAAQCRAARGLIGWSQAELGLQAKVGRATITDFEAGRREPYPRTLQDLRKTFEQAGVEFIAQNGGGVGVRLRKPAESVEHSKPTGPATDAVTAMDAAIEKNRRSKK